MPLDTLGSRNESSGTSPDASRGQGIDQGTGAFQSPTITLPKGGGAIRGIGEKFAANPVTGTGSTSVPIATSPGRSGFGPQLSISYDSGAGNGPFGFGWSLSLPSITRKTDKGLPQYFDAEDSDVFILSGAEDLVPEYRRDPDGIWVASHPEFQRDQEGFWVRDQADRLVIHEEVIDGYQVCRYRPRIEGLFARIERWSKLNAPDDVHWRSISKDNILTLYGLDSNSRIADPLDPSRIFSWLICETRDDKGNAVLYRYKAEDGLGVDLGKACERNRAPENAPRPTDSRYMNRYIKRIHYGNRTSLLDSAGQRPRFLDKQQIDSQIGKADLMFEVVFDYGDHDAAVPKPNDYQAEDPPGILRYPWKPRPDPFSTYRAGFEVRTTRTCQRVLMFHHFPGEDGVERDCLVRSTDFTYSDEVDPIDSRNPVYSFLQAVTQTGYRRNDNGYDKRSLPPVEFEYSKPIVQDLVEQVDSNSLENLPVGLDGGTYRWTDLHGEGIPGILTEQAGTWFYKRNLSPIPDNLPDGREQVKAQFAPLEIVALKPNVTLSGGAEFMDLAGDGQPDVAVLDGPMPGLYEHNEGEGWQPFRPFLSRLNRDLRDPNLKFIDLDGDGHADVLISEDDALVWHASLAEDGFAPAQRVAQALDEEIGPRIVFADGSQSIYLADLSGDGLTDIVRIRNGEVCYWPNLGYGRFGAKVTMDNAPWFDNPDQFDHKRIRLADIDGSGSTDIIYLHRDGVRLYFNQSGNSWSKPQLLKVFPRVDDVVSILPTDLLGNGTACLVWSSPLPGDARRQMRYVNLMGGSKPHLLVKTINNLGAETRVHYAPSTKFYLQDRRDGKPWITRLPFPVHVVEQVETIDHVSRNRFVTQYKYHHGYFDGHEREFRGFGMVEQIDSEAISVLTDNDVDLKIENADPVFHVPPIHTKTWFHTGVFLDDDRISRHLAHEYFGAPKSNEGPMWENFESQLLPDTILPDVSGTSLSAEELREACRALKGSILRQEVYALDNSDKSHLPYSVSERNYTLEVLQSRGNNRYAVFFSHPRETIDYHYERNLDDPRISHSFVLQVDRYGNVERSAAVGYGRLPANVTLTDLVDRAKQTTTLVTISENSFTNAIDYPNIDKPNAADSWRTPLPCEARSFELTGPDVRNKQRFAFDAIKDLVDEATVIQYEAAPEPTKNEKRLIEHVRTVYRSDDLTELLRLGEVESLALPGEGYKLAFTPELVTRIFDSRVTGSLLVEAKYVHATDMDGVEDLNWWISSGRAFFHLTETDNAAELAEAHQNFFVTRRVRDPFGFESLVDYDKPNNLFAIRTIDAVGNATAASLDYRVLQPKLVTDPNGSKAEVKFDILGLVAGTAIYGRNGEGDSIAEFDPDLSDDERTDFFDKPRLPRDVTPYPGTGLLKNATTRLVYDVDRFRREGKPAYTVTLSRETHAVDESGVESDVASKLQLGISYSDGFGREIQKKVQAEPGPLFDGGPDVDPRWVSSGWTVFNNKGKPVRQYEPYFADNHEFEFGKKVGVSPVLFYDPVERVVATLAPDNTYGKVVFDPWRQTTFDANDTIAAHNPADNNPHGLVNQTGDPRTDADIKGYVEKYFASLPPMPAFKTWHHSRIDDASRPYEQQAAIQTEVHANTPSIVHLDTLGRPFLTIAHNRFERAGATIEETHETRVELDIEGNQRSVRDAKQRIVMRYDYDMLGNKLRQDSMEAGNRWTLPDVTGKPIRAWDDRGFDRRMEYDKLHRPTKLFVSAGGLSRLAEETIYGESKQNAEQNAEVTYHRGKPWKVFDDAGVVESELYDFKGNLVKGNREFRTGYKQPANWSPGLPNPEILTGEKFTTVSTFDALNRPVSQTTPDGSVTQPRFNEANLLDAVNVRLLGAANATPFVRNIDYDAKGQRTRIEYNSTGAPIVTEYRYDPATFRLINLKTVRPLHPVPGERVLQNLSYTYDPVGNITHIQDDAQETIYFRNNEIKPHNDYVYDSVYRLIKASGREHLGQNAAGKRLPPSSTSYNDKPRVGLLHPGDDKAMGTYLELFEYDEVGNFQKYKHEGSDPANPGWTRGYFYEEDSLIPQTDAAGISLKSNRLSNTRVDTGPVEEYAHDNHGNMTSMPHLQVMQWDFKDQLQMTQRQAVNDEDADGVQHQGERTWYVYDSSGQRVRKVTEAASGAIKDERIYLSGFEIFRLHSGANSGLVRESLHIMDNMHRIALVETRNDIDDGTSKQLIRFQFGNHLGSASLELDGQAQMISYEEYTPYGSTSYQAVRSQTETPKQYRYTGKERDDESGLYYHGARYYSPWLARWTNCDPAGIAASPNLFAYVSNKPISHIDSTGLADEEPGWISRNLGPASPLGQWLSHADYPGSSTLQDDKKLEVAQSFAEGMAEAGLMGALAAVAVPAAIAGASSTAGGAALTLGASSTTATVAATVTTTTLEAGLTVYGGYQAAQTGYEIGTGKEADTGRTLSDPEVAKRVGGMLVGAIALGHGGLRTGPKSEKPVAGSGKPGTAAPAGEPLLPNLTDAEIGNFTALRPIGGYTDHGLNQAISRNGGRGVSAGAIGDAQTFPKKGILQPGRPPFDENTIRLKGSKGTVIINERGQVITVTGKARGPQQHFDPNARPHGEGPGQRPRWAGSAQRKANALGFSYRKESIR